MRYGRGLPRLYVITDGSRLQGAELADWGGQLAAALPRGALMFQLREKQLDGRQLAELARALIARVRPHACPVLVNDRIDVALAVDADGVQLPEDGLPVEVVRGLGPDLLIGVSRHDVDGVRAAGGADFVVYAPVFATPSKPGCGGAGLEALRQICSVTATPVVALGGIHDARRARAAVDAGAHGVAAIRGLSTPEGVRSIGMAI